VQKCLSNDKTVIKDLQWKINYQATTSNKFQYLFQSDNKYRNARGASATTLKEATTQQTSDKPVGLPLPTHSLTHTADRSDRLVFNNQFTYVHGGSSWITRTCRRRADCAQSRYTGSDSDLRGPRGWLLWNIQSLTNRTTGISSRSLSGTYQTTRPLVEAKTDGTYFLTARLGGDHSLKFGLGWRRNPIQTFSHYSAARARPCSASATTATTAATAATLRSAPRPASCRTRPICSGQLLNNDWWTYNGYFQDSYKPRPVAPQRRPPLRLAAVEVPRRLRPGQRPRPDHAARAVREETMNDRTRQGESSRSATGRRACPRPTICSATARRRSTPAGSYFYNTKITLANSLGGLFTSDTPDAGSDLSRGALQPDSDVWTDAKPRPAWCRSTS
jgi:hypothetical protein